MKTSLRLAVVLGVLLSLLAFPVMAAGGDTPIYVSHLRLAWTGRSSTGTDIVVGMIFVRDANHHRVEDALVSVDWYLDGVYLTSDSMVTSRQGFAQSSVWGGEGDYQLYVTGVSLTGYVYCPTIVATPVYTVY